jgi:hypothetical protein
MTSTDQERIVRFIEDAKEHRQWLSRELSSLDANSEDYESNRRAILGAVRELDRVISERDSDARRSGIMPNDSHA